MEKPDKREALLLALQSYIQRRPERAAVAERMMEFVASTPDCFERSHAAGHITGSAWLLNPARDKALLTLHRKLGLWLQPGGHADGDADVLRVALREAVEESGIAGITHLNKEIFDVDIHLIPAYPAGGVPEHLHYDVRYLLQAPHERFAISHESLALSWFSLKELESMNPPADESVLRLAHQCWLPAAAEEHK